MEINLSKDYKEEEKTPVGFEESDKPAPGFEYEVNDGRSDNSGAASFCTRCGTPLNGSSFCPNCGHAAENNTQQSQQSSSGYGYGSSANYSNTSNYEHYRPNMSYQQNSSNGSFNSAKPRNKVLAIILAVFSCGILSAIYDCDVGRIIRNVILACIGLGGIGMILDIIKIAKYDDTYYI